MNNSGNRLNTASINTRQSYPWLSILSTVLVIFYLLIKDKVILSSVINLPFYYATDGFLYFLLAICTSLLIFDIHRFMHNRKRIKTHTDRLKLELESVWESKKKLHHKAHTYSGHAEKLKLFISDKLLEYIEYDEKFLHFKNIAAEVRHNGVISYDVVKTALEQALLVEKGHISHKEAIINYQRALDAMRYLWDLLDLSTTDNISLHIANHLIECEEHYYQVMLNQEQGDEIYYPAPYEPDFSAAQAAINTIKTLLGSLLSADGFITKEDGTIHYEDNQFRISIATDKTLLGNENHVRLILENVLKNAQYFSSKVPYKQGSDRISLQVLENRGNIEYIVYNRGPHIADNDIKRLYQPGYSTRRAREHHGKGLGLFFVNEIVKGYEGSIAVDNIMNQSNTYSIRIALQNGDIITKVVEVDTRTTLPLAGEAKNSPTEKTLVWSFSNPIESMEISETPYHNTHRFNDFSNKTDTTLLDPGNPHTPLWSVYIQPKRRGNKNYNVEFTPLDISGVRFTIRLPSACSRMEEDNQAFIDDFDQEVDKLNQYFKEG